MPRRALLLLTALVLALHWLALAGLPRGTAGAGEPERTAFHTRMLQPPPEAAAAPAASARPAPRPHKRPARKPAPPPEPLSERPAADSPPVELASAAHEAADAPLPAPEPSSDLPPEPLPEPSSEPSPEPSSGPPQETAAAPEPAQPPPAEPVKSAEESGPGAGVEILPPGAGGAMADDPSLARVISETGLELSKWHSQKHLTSWARLAPGTAQSGNQAIPRACRAGRSWPSWLTSMVCSWGQHASTVLKLIPKRRREPPLLERLLGRECELSKR